MLGGDGDGSFNSNGSRWGVKGSTELSEGLSAVYNFEAGLDGATATQTPGNRLSYMGLSGGFGNITMGRLWSATENNAGGWRFLNPWFGSSDTTGRISHAVSYAFNSEMAGFQVDAVMDPNRDSGDTVDEFRFGATIKLGELGKIGFAHANIENEKKPEAMSDPFTRGDLPGLATDPTHKTLVITPGMTEYAPLMLSGSEFEVDDNGMLVVSKWAHGEDSYTGDAPATYMISANINLETGNFEAMAKPATPKILTFWSDGHASDTKMKSNYVASTDGTTFSLKDTCETAEDRTANSCVSRTHFAFDIQDHLTEAEAETGGGAPNGFTQIYVPVAGQPGALQPGGFVGPAMWKIVPVEASETDDPTVAALHNGNRESIMVTAEVDGDKDTSTVKSVTPASIRIEDADYEAKDNETTESIVTGIGVDYEEDTTPTTPMSDPEPKYGSTENHVTLQLGLGAMTGTLGYSEVDSNDPAKKMDKKITFLGLNGAIGDTGMSWTAYSRSTDDHDGSDTNSWGASLSKSLGAGTSAYIDHGNDGSDGATFVGLSVSF